MSKKRTGKDWTVKERLEALVLLRNNNFNLSKTSKEIGGVTVNTLKKWKTKYGEQAYKDLDEILPPIRKDREYKVSLMKVSGDLRERNIKFINKSYDLKMKTLDRLKMLLPKETNMSRVTEALKLLHEISADPSTTPGDESSKSNVYLQQIKNIYNLK
jgi:transposase-like protein